METDTDLDGVEVVTRNTYDPVGRLEMTVVTSGEVSDTTLRSYNVRGWQTSIENDHWSAVMRYNNPIHSDSTASFTGNISEWEWSRGENTETKAYSFDYDVLSRIVDSRLFRNGTPTEALSEKNIIYDSNGNILALKRTGEDGSIVNDLVYSYDGNRLASFSDGVLQSQNYTYDADGNMTFDGRTGMSLTWNDLGLVEKVRLNDTDMVHYSYLADGTKVSALDNEGNGLLYLGSLIYKKTGDSIELESAGFAGGRFVARETSPGVSAMVPMFHVTDHLGSVRAVVDGISGEVIETNDYYPFGSRWNTSASLTDQTNRFRYNSKEEQFRFGTPYIDYGARQYDPILGRWFAQDPLSESSYSISSYTFCNNNPIYNIDCNGLFPYKYDWNSGNYVNTDGQTVSWGEVYNYIKSSAASHLSELKSRGANMLNSRIENGSVVQASIGMLGEFVMGLGPEKRSFNSSHAMSESLKQSRMTRVALKIFWNKYSQTGIAPPYYYVTWGLLGWKINGLGKETGVLSEYLYSKEFNAPQFIGSAKYMFDIQGDILKIRVEDTKNTWSLFYHITNDRDGHTRDEFPLFGTTSQIYNFSIPLKEIPNIIK